MDFAIKNIVIATVIFGTILVIIFENRNPVKTIAWCMVLTFMPVIGLLLYILFGMDNRHRRQIKDEDLSRLKPKSVIRIWKIPNHDAMFV